MIGRDVQPPADVLHRLAPSRLAILEALRDGPLTVGEVVVATGLTQPNASNHLRCLAECGLVAGERAGRFSRYRLSDAKTDTLLALADDLLRGTAQGIEGCRNYRNTPKAQSELK